jgi:hypothetical protein
MERTPEYYHAQRSGNDKFITLYGVPFMKVTPVPSLLISKTLKAAVARGDWLVVNMNTGDLTIYSKKRQLADSAGTLGASLRARLDARPEPAFFLVNSVRQYALSSNAEEATQQIKRLSNSGVNILNSTVRCINYNCGKTVTYDDTMSFTAFLLRVKGLIAMAHSARSTAP